MFDAQRFLKQEAELGTGLRLYARFGNLPPRGFSYNQHYLCFEPGISCFDLKVIAPDIVEIDQAPLDAIMTVREAVRAQYKQIIYGSFLSRPVYLVTGEECRWRGSDREPCLKWAELMGMLIPLDVASETVKIQKSRPEKFEGLRMAQSAGRFRIDNSGSDPAADGFYPTEREAELGRRDSQINPGSLLKNLR